MGVNNHLSNITDFYIINDSIISVYHYLCNQCLSPLTSWVRIPFRRSVLDTTLCDKVCQWLAAGRWVSPGTPVSSTNKTDHHNIAEILLKVTLNTINQPYILYRMAKGFLLMFGNNLMWNDPRLRWESEPHILRLPTFVIWTPDIVLYNK